jgi:hypothetical protein
MFGFASCPSGSYEPSYEPLIPFVAFGYTERPTLGSCGEASRRVQDRDTLAVVVTSKVVHYHVANPKGGTPTASVATLAVQSVAVTVAVDPPGALIEGKSSAVVVFVSCRQASSAASLG